MTRTVTRTPAVRTVTIAAGLLAAIAVAVVIGSGISSGAPAAQPGSSAPITTAGHPARAQRSAGGGGPYGGLPSWLPRATVPVGRVVTASRGRPWLAVEGDTVDVRLATGRALMTVVGPAVPPGGHFPMPRTTPCTFTVTLIARGGHVRVDARAFSIVDELGQRHRPRLARRGGGRLPIVLAAGHSLVLTGRAVLPIGNGQLRFTPSGARPIASWDFAVEID